MPRDRNYSRGAAPLLALIVGALTLTCTSRALQTAVIPSGAFYQYNLAAGANSVAITPAPSQSVFVMGDCLTLGFRGTGHVSLLRIAGSFLEWTGIESPSAAAITSGFSASSGTHMVWIDFSHAVDIQVNTADTFVVHNGSTGTRAGNITMFW